MNTKLTLISCYVNGRKSHIFKQCVVTPEGKTIASQFTINKLQKECNYGSELSRGTTFSIS